MLLSLLLVAVSSVSFFDADATLAEARRALERSLPQEAVSVLTALVEGGDEAAKILMSEVQAALGEPEAGFALLEGLAEDDIGVLIAKGRCQLATADKLAAASAAEDDVASALYDAYDTFDKAASLSEPEDARALVQLGNMHLYRFGEHEQALELAAEGLVGAPENGDLLLLSGSAGVFVYYNAKQAGDLAAAEAGWAAAVDALDRSVKSLPEHRVEPWGQLAWLHEDKDNREQAVRANIAILDRQTVPSFDNLYRLAVRYSFDRDWNASSQALQKLVSLSSLELSNRLRTEAELDRVATELAWSIDPFVKRGDAATALMVLRGIVRAEPKAPEVWHNFAVLCEQTNANEEALAAYEKLTALDPRNPRAFNDLGSFLHHNLNRDLERAQELYRTAIAMAEEQLKDEKLKPDRRNELRTARDLAQSSLNELVPPTPEKALGGLLGGLLEGLGDAAEEAEGEATEGEEAEETGGEDASS